jgi:hypothetical protein
MQYEIGAPMHAAEDPGVVQHRRPLVHFERIAERAFLQKSLAISDLADLGLEIGQIRKPAYRLIPDPADGLVIDRPAVLVQLLPE